MEILKFLQKIFMVIWAIGMGLILYGSNLYRKSENDSKKRTLGFTFVTIGMVIVLVDVAIFISQFIN